MQVDLPSALKTSVESSKAEYTQLGKCGLRVSVPIFGTMSLVRSKWSEWVKDEDQVCLNIIACSFSLDDIELTYHRGWLGTPAFEGDIRQRHQLGTLSIHQMNTDFI